MGYEAWDVDLQDFIDADNANTEKKKKGKFLCPTAECRKIGIPVHLVECENGNHFSTSKGYADKHFKDCDFPSRYKNGTQYRKKNYTVFDIETLITNLSEKPITANVSTQEKKDYVAPTENNSHQEMTININNLNKLYGAVIHNTLDFYITPDYKVNDISISERNSSTAKNPINKPVLFIGKTTAFIYNEMYLWACSNYPNSTQGIKVRIHLDKQSLNYLKKRLQKFDKKCVGIRIAILASFKSKEEVFISNGKTIRYTLNYANCSANQIKIIDRVTCVDKQNL